MRYLILLLLTITLNVNAQTTLSGRISTCDSLPLLKPSGFSSSDFMYVRKDSSTWMWKLGWMKAPIRLNAKDGAVGPQGPQGPIGPQGPAGSSTSTGTLKGFVSNWTEFVQAYNDKTLRSITLMGNITQTSKLYLDKNYSNILEINGNGYDWNTTIDTAIVRRYASLTEANQGIDMQLRMTNISFKGNNNMLMYLEANYGAKFEGCRFYNFGTALGLFWAMGTEINQCYFWENKIGIELDYARFVGGSNSASQSNHCIITNCKFRNSAGDFANIKATAVSGLQILHNIFEGTQAGGDYDIFFDDNNSNVVKEVIIYGNHVEHQPRIASTYIKLKEGIAKVGGIYSQYDCTLIKFESSAYAKMIVENIPFLTTLTKFENVRAEGRWQFVNLPSSFTPTTTDRWVGAMPINSRFDLWDSNGQQPYIQLGSRKL
jgi:hypothetical protein